MAGHHHVVPLSVNLKTFAALLALTVITVYTATNIHLGGAGNLILAMIIAGFKAFIVLGWFMHLKYDTVMNRAIAVCGIAFLALMIGFSYLDIATR